MLLLCLNTQIEAWPKRYLCTKMKMAITSAHCFSVFLPQSNTCNFIGEWEIRKLLTVVQIRTWTSELITANILLSVRQVPEWTHLISWRNTRLLNGKWQIFSSVALTVQKKKRAALLSLGTKHLIWKLNDICFVDLQQWKFFSTIFIKTIFSYDPIYFFPLCFPGWFQQVVWALPMVVCFGNQPSCCRYEILYFFFF